MSIQILEVSDFRNLRSLRILPSPSINWIVGDNGSGKSSLLEAIYFIGTGKSFRSNVPRQYINRDAKQCTVFSSLALAENLSLPLKLGLQKEIGGTTSARCNGEAIKRLSDLARFFPVVALLPDSTQILDGDPTFRREFLDWTMFHVEHQSDYFDIYRSFNRILLQRNGLLKELADKRIHSVESLRNLAVWDDQFVEVGQRLSSLRESFLDRMFAQFAVTSSMHQLTEGKGNYFFNKVCFTFSQGWAQQKTLRDALEEAKVRDLERGFSSIGPQRFDIKISYDGIPVKEFFSRGQKKHLISLCKIRQAELFRDSHKDGNLIFLFDDVFSELDKHHAFSIIEALKGLRAQVFATSVEPPESKGFSLGIHDKMFHVEHGSVDQEAVINLTGSIYNNDTR